MTDDMTIHTISAVLEAAAQADNDMKGASPDARVLLAMEFAHYVIDAVDYFNSVLGEIDCVAMKWINEDAGLPTPSKFVQGVFQEMTWLTV